MRFIGLNKVQLIDKIGQKADHVFRFGSSQFSLCTLETYNELIEHFKINKMPDSLPYSELAKIDEAFKNEYPSTFNLWEGGKFKSNVLEYRKDYNGYHPTQKPVLLLEDLIKTYSNENNLIVDLTMGSGSTGVAARNCNRRFIGIEQDLKYFEIAQMRINKEIKPPEQIRDENGFYQSTIFDYL